MIGSGDGADIPQDINRGWYLVPAEIFAERNRQGIGRFTGGLTANWRPTDWLSTRATFGYDVTNKQDTQFWPTGEVNPFAYPTENEGELKVTRGQTSQLSVDLVHRRQLKVSSAWSGRTAVGGQYFRNLNTSNFPRDADWRGALNRSSVRQPPTHPTTTSRAGPRAALSTSR